MTKRTFLSGQTAANILLISPEPWNYLNVSKHHYATELARRGNRVFFLNPPGRASRLQLRSADAGHPGIQVVDYTPSIKGQRFLPGFCSRFLDKRFLKDLEQKAGCTINVLWNFENSRFFDFRFVPASVLKIYHQVDLNQDFHVATAAKTADICFCTTDFILEKLQPHNPKSFKIHHGVTAAALSAGGSAGAEHRPAITATYIGNLDIPYLDIDLLAQLVANYPTVHFVFVGHYSVEGAAYRKLARYGNIEWTGAVRAEQVGTYLQASDLLLVCYKADIYREQLASPHKMMEYLASGKTVVATYTDEYKDKGDLLAMTHTNGEYVGLFEHVLTNIDQFNNMEQQEKRRNFARQNLYSCHLDRIATLTEQYVMQH